MNKFSLALSAGPTSIGAKQFNEQVIDRLNRTLLAPGGLQGVKPINFAWSYGIQARYFLRPNFTVDAGVSQIRTISKREFQPAIGMAVQYQAELLSAPVSLGGTYYLPAYNQGDFQARWYLGGGLLSNTFNRARFMAVEANTDSAHSLGGNFKLTARRDSPGYYLESGVHMFFASRFSVILGGGYRSAMIRQAVGEFEPSRPRGIVGTLLPSVIDIDLGGVGGKLAFCIGL